MNWLGCDNCWHFTGLDKQVFSSSRFSAERVPLFSNLAACVPSGGDDRRVLLWHMEKAIHGRSKPVKLKGEHLSNIFCLAFDSSNRKVFSGGESNTPLPCFLPSLLPSLLPFAVTACHIKTFNRLTSYLFLIYEICDQSPYFIFFTKLQELRSAFTHQQQRLEMNYWLKMNPNLLCSSALLWRHQCMLLTRR